MDKYKLNRSLPGIILVQLIHAIFFIVHSSVANIQHALLLKLSLLDIYKEYIHMENIEYFYDIRDNLL